MPAPYRKERPYPGTYRTLKEAADSHQLIVVYCGGCRRLVRYLASDLLEFFDERRDVMLPPYPCSRCSTSARLRLTVISPSGGDYGALEVRRPGPVISKRTWRTVKLGDP
jgi:hypothetical protein